MTHRVDPTDLPFPDESYDLAFDPHVLEHIKDDAAALREISRILRPGGLAVLPVPVVGAVTVEYPATNPFEAGHVRAPGADYFGRYFPYFRSVQVVTSEELPAENQPYIFEDRSRCPNRYFPLRTAAPGLIHSDFVPLGWA